MNWQPTVLIMALALPAGAQQAPPPATPKDKLSCAMGMDLGQQLKTQSVDVARPCSPGDSRTPCRAARRS
jgi:hypothetical protein